LAITPKLVLAWIRDPATRWFDRLLEQAEGRSGAPAQVIPVVFDEVAEWLERDGYRGCPYLHTIAEVADVEADRRVRGAASVYVDDIRQHLRRAAAAAGADPAIGDQIHALLTGAMELAVVYRSSHPQLLEYLTGAELAWRCRHGSGAGARSCPTSWDGCRAD